jgi:hypothetical protein
VGITIDKQRATERFGQALVLARSDTPLPEEWIGHARAVGTARNRTFTPILGTALLARAADDEVDVASLREDESSRGYSARSLAKDILVPYCARAGIDLRNKGPEPLNNQPFLKAPRVSTDLKVKKSAVPALEHLCRCLDALESLRGKAALEALAAFLRVRIQESRLPTPIELGSGVLELPELLSAIDAITLADDTGVVGVASVAAALSLCFSEVRTRHANDPTSALVGHVGGFDRSVQTLAVDVGNRAASDADMLLFARQMAGGGVRRGVVVCLSHATVDAGQLQFQARRLHQVELTILQKTSELVRLAFTMARDDLTLSLASFPRLVLQRMGALKVDQSLLLQWTQLFADSPLAGEAS